MNANVRENYSEDNIIDFNKVSDKRKIERKQKVRQKIVGLLLLVISVLILFVWPETDKTAAIPFFGLGIWLVLSREIIFGDFE